MSKILPPSIQSLIEEFAKLPGIGPKTAGRLTFFLLTKPQKDINAFGEAVLSLKEGLVNCEKCFNISQKSPCEICSDERRDLTKIMVVEESLDVLALSKTNFNGLYHVLGGAISPIDGIGPDNLRIKELLDKLKKDTTSEKTKKIEEVILATDPSLEGEATAMYISKQIEKNGFEVNVTRIARGLPVGSDLEYADEITLSRALEGRNKY
jgi:recombination protein RecR